MLARVCVGVLMCRIDVRIMYISKKGEGGGAKVGASRSESESWK